MASLTSVKKRALEKRYKSCPIKSQMRHAEVGHLHDYFAIMSLALQSNVTFWFRGHASLEYTLAPSALRLKTDGNRTRALNLLNDLKRFLEIKLPRPPTPTETLKWVQIAQHYGLKTRLLDWTQNAAVALYFACCSETDKDGLVVILNPIDLNAATYPQDPRILDESRSKAELDKYWSLDGRPDPHGLPTVAINPVWNSERIVLQQGFFTLHGSKEFELDARQAPGLAYIPILRDNKGVLRDELERVGISEMTIFPEPEYVCKHLIRNAKLT